MAKYSAVKATVNAYIKQNGRKEITGKVLNAVLNATIDSLGKYFQFAGGALPTDNPGTPDQNVCYLAGEPGVYTNFGGITIENEEVALLFWNGEWTKQRILIGIREVNASVDNQVGTPSVDVDFVNNVLTLSFHNIKGDKGDTGDPAGFGQVTASVDDTIGNPSVQVQTSGEDTAKNIAFEFHGLRGETGITSVVVSVDNTTGNPACSVSLVGQVLHLDFTGLKGLKGDTGVSADYPITIYNGLDSDATDQALAAAQGKVLDGKVSQLGQKVDDLSTGKYYGYFAQEEDLPEADVDGFAYVGEGPTYTIYNLRGGVWTSSGITVNQAPIGNDEDINQNEGGKLQFADRSSGSGMGYVILRKNKTFDQQVTAANTIYEIRYDFDLGGASVTIPAGCVLRFNGGSISNGTIDFSGCHVESESPCFSNITPVGLYNIKVVWFGILPGAGHDIGAMLTALVASLNYKASLIFERDAYYTTTTITISGSYNILGFPTFTTSQENMKCISISACYDSTLQFNVRKLTTARWKDTGSIGVELVGLLRCTIQIEQIQMFTYGIELVARAGVATGGFAWNNLYISSITAALQSIVIISEGGWPNGNNIYGTGFFRYGGQWDATDATEPLRYIVFKNDSYYGMSGWRFIGLFFENHSGSSPTIAGVPFANIDLQTYVSQAQGQHVSTYNLVFDGRWESTGSMILVNSNYVPYHAIELRGYNVNATGLPIAIDEHGTSVVGSLVDVYGEKVYEKHLIHVNDRSTAEDVIGNGKFSPDARICGLGIYNKVTRKFGVYGNDAKCVLLENMAGVRLKIIVTKGANIRVCALDATLNKLDVRQDVFLEGYLSGLLSWNETYKWYYRGVAGEECVYLNINPSPSCKYIALAVLNGEMDIYKLIEKKDGTTEQFAYPFGKTTGIIIADSAWTSLRNIVRAGQRIYDGTHLYTILKGGSIGNIGAVTATGTLGENTLSVSSATYLYAEDMISVDSVEYVIVSKSGTTLTLDKPLETSPEASAVSLVAPVYFTEPSSNPQSS